MKNIEEMVLGEVVKEIKELMFVLPDGDEHLDLKQRFEELQLSIPEKVVQAVKAVKYVQGQSDSINNEIKRLKDIKSRIDTRIEDVKQIIGDTIYVNDLKIDSDIGTICKHTSQSVECFGDAETYPEEYRNKKEVITYSANKDAIKKAIEAGKFLDFAVINTTRSFSVR